MNWGRCVTRWHDEIPTLHILRDDGSPRCGTQYYSTAGRVSAEEAATSMCKCRKCERIATKAEKS